MLFSIIVNIHVALFIDESLLLGQRVVPLQEQVVESGLQLLVLIGKVVVALSKQVVFIIQPLV